MATALILDELNGKTKKVFPVNYPVVKVKDFTRNAKISDVLPFRVRFTTIQIQAIGLGNTPAIPLQVIGYSNYIL
jgi:hypothetical protein